MRRGVSPGNKRRWLQRGGGARCRQEMEATGRQGGAWGGNLCTAIIILVGAKNSCLDILAEASALHRDKSLPCFEIGIKACPWTPKASFYSDLKKRQSFIGEEPRGFDRSTGDTPEQGLGRKNVIPSPGRRRRLVFLSRTQAIKDLEKHLKIGAGALLPARSGIHHATRA